MLPALSITMGDIFEAIVKNYGESARGCVRWNPIPEMEERLARFPPLETPLAEGLGFRHDGSVDVLVQRTLDMARSIREGRSDDKSAVAGHRHLGANQP